MGRSLRWGVLSGALVTALSPGALANGGAAEHEAQARFEEGIARVKTGNFDGARVSFTQAYAVLRRPYILWNLALAEEKTGHALDALEHFKDFARGRQDGDERGGAQKHIAELMAQTGHLDVVARAGSQVFVDGAPEGTVPLADSVDVAPGRHHVEAHTPRGEREVDVDVEAGQVLRVNLLPVTESAVSPGPAPAQNAPAPSFSSDSPVSATPMARPPIVAPPAHSSDGTSSGESSRRRVIVVVVAGATAAVSIAVGAYFALQSESDGSTAAGFRALHTSDYCFQVTSANGSVCKQWNDAVQAQSRDAALSSVFYVTGGVLAAGAVATWFLWPKGRTSAWAFLTPAVTPGGGGLSAVGQF
jgi:hypothetical protein